MDIDNYSNRGMFAQNKNILLFSQSKITKQKEIILSKNTVLGSCQPDWMDPDNYPKTVVSSHNKSISLFTYLLKQKKNAKNKTKNHFKQKHHSQTSRVSRFYQHD